MRSLRSSFRVGQILVAHLVLAGLAWAAPEPKSIALEDAGPFHHVDGSGLRRQTLELLRHRRNEGRTAAARAAMSEDVGDVAVIADNGSLVIQPRPTKPIDLPMPAKLSFAPTTDGFAVHFEPPGMDAAIGVTVPLGDDSFVEVALAFPFSFLGGSYDAIFVNSDGNITFGRGDDAATPRDGARLVGGPPRVAPLLSDLDVTSGGSIHADLRADRAVVTWTDVPEFGIANRNTFQVTLHSNGRIDLAYDHLDATTGVVGVAAGGDTGPINEVDLTAALPATFPAGAIFEEFAPAIPVQQVDVLAVAKEFYKTHGDNYDFLVMFTDFASDLGDNVFAFESTLKNQTRGIGDRLQDNSDSAGSAGELESIVHMNRIGLYWPDAAKMVDPPIKKFLLRGGASSFRPPRSEQISIRARLFGTFNDDFGAHGAFTLGLNSAMSFMGQEVGHRWLALTPFVHPTKGIGADSFDLLGRQGVHWSFFFNVRVPRAQFPGDPRASSMEGNAIVDLGPSTLCQHPGEHRFLTERDELVDGYTELDQYLMGLRRAGDVGPFWYVDEPTRIRTGESVEEGAGERATDDITFCGKRVDLTVADIQSYPGVGPRVPAIGDEDDDGLGNDIKTMAFILLVEQGPPKSAAHSSAIGQVDTLRQTWERYANGPATGGRGRFDTTLNPVVH